MLGQAEMHLGHLTEAQRLFTAGLAGARDVGHARLELAVLNEMARSPCSAMTSIRRSRTSRRRSRSQHAENWRESEAVILSNLAELAIDLERWPYALTNLEASLALRREFGDLSGLAIVLPALAYIHVELGQLVLALAYYDEAVSVCRSTGNTVDGWSAAVGRSVVNLALGHLRPALSDARAALTMCTDVRPYETAASLRLVSKVARRAGRDSLAAYYQGRADEAYARHSGRVTKAIEALLSYGE